MSSLAYRIVVDGELLGILRLVTMDIDWNWDYDKRTKSLFYNGESQFGTISEDSFNDALMTITETYILSDALLELHKKRKFKYGNTELIRI